MTTFTATGWAASYHTGRGGPAERDVQAWHPDGRALVVDPAQGRLVPADSMPGFAGLVEKDRLVAALPAAAGTAARVWPADDDSDTAAWSEWPVAVWLVGETGLVYPVPRQADGTLTPVGGLLRRVEVYVT